MALMPFNSICSCFGRKILTFALTLLHYLGGYANLFPNLTRFHLIQRTMSSITIYILTNSVSLSLSLQGDYGQSHKFCAGESPVPDFYSYGRTISLHFKSDTFMPGNGMSLTYQVAGRRRGVLSTIRNDDISHE